MLTRSTLFIAATAVALLGAAGAIEDSVTAGVTVFITAITVALLGAARTMEAEFVSSARSATRVEYGSVDAIQVFRTGDNRPIHVATLLGGIAGGVIGHPIGGASGQTLATIGGAFPGSVFGKGIEKREVEGARYRITVKLESGATLNIEDNTAVNLRVGNRVRVENDRIYRE